MRIGIHQPEHLPWLGFFDRMAAVDLFVILDHTNFKKNNFQNRNRVEDRNSRLPKWITVPVSGKTRINTRICDVRIAQKVDWQKEYLTSIERNYRNCSSFGRLFPILESIINGEHNLLSNLNVRIIEWIRKELSINTPMVLSSRMNLHHTKSQMLVEICEMVGATQYVSGVGGLQYLDITLFKERAIDVVFRNYGLPKKLGQFEYIDGLSTLVPMMHCQESLLCFPSIFEGHEFRPQDL